MKCCDEIGCLGWPWLPSVFKCCNSWDKGVPVVEKELGLGIALYFRLTSFLAFMFSVFTLISVPVYILYY